MHLNNIEPKKQYKIINFGNLNKEEILYFYEQGIIEGEHVRLDNTIKTSKNIIIIEIDNNYYSFNKKFAKEIEVEEING